MDPAHRPRRGESDESKEKRFQGQCWKDGHSDPPNDALTLCCGGEDPDGSAGTSRREKHRGVVPEGIGGGRHRIWRQVNPTDTSRRRVSKRHIFSRFFSQLSRRKAYTDLQRSIAVACETGITKGTTVKRPNAANFGSEDTLKRAGMAGWWKGLVGAVRRTTGLTVSESAERSIFA